MESTRPPGFPGNPPARMPRAPTPARSPPPRPLRRGEMTFRPTHDVGPRTQCISGLNHAALRAPCERFAPWVTPGPRITRFRLAADLGRMGLVTHRVSNKVSKITSRHLVPLDRVFPAHALVHKSKLTGRIPTDGASPTHGVRVRPAHGGHRLEYVAREQCLGRLPARCLGSQAIADNRLVSKKRVLNAGLLLVA